MSARVDRYDPFAARSDDRVLRRLLLVVVLTVATQALVAGGFAVNASLADRRAAESRVTMVEVAIPDPPPPPDPPPDAPPPPPEPVRPRQIGMSGESFAGTGSGPRFASGDTARGGRPSRISVDPNDTRKAVDNLPAAPTGTGDKPAIPDRDATLKGRPDFNRYGYPDAAQKQLVEGDCRVSLRVGTDGRVASITSIDCTRTEVGFEDYLRRYIPREMRFKPAIRGGVEAVSEVVFTHEFRLPGR